MVKRCKDLPWVLGRVLEHCQCYFEDSLRRQKSIFELLVAKVNLDSVLHPAWWVLSTLKRDYAISKDKTQRKKHHYVNESLDYNNDTNNKTKSTNPSRLATDSSAVF